MSASPPAPLCIFSPSFMLLGDWPSPSFMCVWVSTCVWKSFDSLSKGQGFSLTLCQITGHLTDEHSYTAKHVDAIPLLACHIFQCYLPHMSHTHTYSYNISFSQNWWLMYHTVACVMFHSLEINSYQTYTYLVWGGKKVNWKIEFCSCQGQYNCNPIILYTLMSS